MDGSSVDFVTGVMSFPFGSSWFVCGVSVNDREHAEAANEFSWHSELATGH